MSQPSLKDVGIDPLVVGSHPDPYPIYRRMRDLDPVHYCATRDVWLLSRFADVQAAARDWRSYSSADGTDLDDFGVLAGQGEVGHGVFIDTDPPSHDVMRELVRHAFTPAAVNALGDRIDACVRERLSFVRGAGVVEAVGEVIVPIVVGTVSAVLGIPQQDQPQLARLLGRIARRTAGDPCLPESARGAVAELGEYAASMLRERERSPRDDLMTTIAEADVNGRRLSQHESVGLMLLLLTAGTETTISLLGSGLRILHDHPDQRERGARMHDVTPLVEEILRFDAPVQWLARTTTADVALHDAAIPRGARVALLFGSANRDERRYSDPDVFDIDRTFRRNVAFGEGIHHCLGAPIARMEAKLFFRALLTDYPRYTVGADIVREHTHSRSRSEVRRRCASP